MLHTSRLHLAILAAVLLPLCGSDAAVSLIFNGNTSNTVTGSPGTINANAGGTFQLTLQLFSTSEGTRAVDYWLSQFSGPMGNVFSITGRDYTGSDFPDPSATNAQALSTADTGSNSAPQGASGRTPDGIADNRFGPQNAWDLGSVKADTTTNNPAGTFQIATFTIAVAAGSTPGMYQIRTFDYTGFGWSSTTVADQPFASQAAINVNVIPEPSTWLLLGVGGLVWGGVSVVRRKRLA